MAITLTHGGYIKRTPLTAYRRQGRGTKGVLGHGQATEEDFVEHLFVASTHAYLLFFTSRGKCYWLKVYGIPEASRTAKGRGVRNLLEVGPEEKITAIVPVADLTEGANLIFATKRGQVKRTPLEQFSRPKRGGIIALTLGEGDDLVGVQLERPRADVVLLSARGKATRFGPAEVRPQGRAAAGVRGMKLGKGDEVVAMLSPAAGEAVLVVSEKGLGKKTPVKDYRKMHRGGGGVITLKASAKTGLVMGGKAVTGDEDLVLITEKGRMNRMAVKAISTKGRATQGVRVMKLEQGDRVAAMAVVKEEREE